MKHLLSTLLLSAVALCASAQQGTWKGNLKVQGITLPLVFHLSENASTLDSPAQGAKGIPVTREQLADGTLRLAVPSIGATYEGKLSGQQISGRFTQNGFSLPLDLTPGDDVVRRPQTPVAPFPYKEEQVSFANGGFTFNGTLVLPENASKSTPVVVMLTGSGQQNRDEEIYGHKPFAVIADALARQGIASFRYDDRAWGDSTADFSRFTTADFKADAIAAVSLMRERFARVGALGHSEGGTIALMLAADGKVDFAASLAGMAVSGMQTLVMQNRQAIAQLGLPANVTDPYCQAVERTLTAIGEGRTPTDAELAGVPAQLKSALEQSVKQCSTPYFQHFLKLDIRPSLPSVKCPVLALNGTLDQQVDATSNLAALEKGLTHSALTLKRLDGLNHLFQHCTTGSVVEYQQIEETIAPEVLTTLTDWISSLGK